MNFTVAMNRRILIVLLFFLYKFSLAQETKESFLNASRSSILEGSFKHSGHGHFYLSPEAKVMFEMEFHSVTPDDLKIGLRSSLSNTDFNEIMSNLVDTTTESWDFDFLKKARRATGKRPARLYTHNKILLRYSFCRNRTRFCISKPLFNKNKDWAVIAYCGHSRLKSGRGYAYGSTYIFHKVNGHWGCIKQLTDWIT